MIQVQKMMYLHIVCMPVGECHICCCSAKLKKSVCSRDGKPSVRIVLMKGYSKKGFCFYTNYDSRKGKELVSMIN